MNTDFGATELRASIAAVVERHGYFDKECNLQVALHAHIAGLHGCERERPIRFGPASYIPPQPCFYGEGLDVCAQKGCRKLDLLVHSGLQSIAIELKCSRDPTWRGTYNGNDASVRSTSDVVTYGFLKDIHRMERLSVVQAEGGLVVPVGRLCALLTNDPYVFEARTIHESMRLSPRTISPGHAVQYNPKTARGKDTSPKTLWRDYPPFCLAGSYELKWHDLRNDVTGFKPAPGVTGVYGTYRLLIVEVG